MTYCNPLRLHTCCTKKADDPNNKKTLGNKKQQLNKQWRTTGRSSVNLTKPNNTPSDVPLKWRHAAPQVQAQVLARDSKLLCRPDDGTRFWFRRYAALGVTVMFNNMRLLHHSSYTIHVRHAATYLGWMVGRSYTIHYSKPAGPDFSYMLLLPTPG